VRVTVGVHVGGQIGLGGVGVPLGRAPWSMGGGQDNGPARAGVKNTVA
jgi:hypothetical protein